MGTIFDLSGHVSVVTGGNSGVGLGLATGLAKAGARVAVWGRNEETLAAAVSALEAHGSEAAAFRCDVASEEQVEEAMAATLARFERVDSCFANAGFSYVKPFLRQSVEDWRAILDVNITGAFLTFRAAVRHMVNRGEGGKLVGISSIGSLHGMPGQEPYAVTKAGMIGLVRALAVEFARDNIQANAIMPGWIDTPATEPAQHMEKLNATILKRTPARRWGTAQDLEGVAVYLASPASDFQTGDVIKLDGGYTSF